MRVIHGDVILNFGKYKNQPVADVLARDAGYFYWLVMHRRATLAPDVAEVVSDWAKSHPAEAKRIANGALANAAPGEQSQLTSDFTKVASVEVERKEEPQPERGEDWGSW